MKKNLVDILACPVCKSPLKLDIVKEERGDVVDGSLFCQKCNHKYVIKDSIPNLLPPDAA
jgi:uncharacterized protein YbaR (Trm112 family)